MTDKYERIPMRSYEADGLNYLFGCYQEITGAIEALRKRLEIVGRKEQLGRLNEELGEVIDEILRTVPLNKLQSIKANLSNLKLTIKIDKPVTGKENPSYSYVDKNLLAQVLKSFHSEKCALCMGSPDVEKKCKYRELMDVVVVEDLPENPYSCKYRDAFWAENGGNA